MKELRCQKCPNGGLRIVHYPYAECVWGWTLDRQGCGALYRLDDDADGLTEVDVPLVPVSGPSLTTTYTGGVSGGFKGLLELGPMMTTIDTFYSDSSAANYTSANVITGVTNIAERWWKEKYPNFPEWGETA